MNAVIYIPTPEHQKRLLFTGEPTPSALAWASFAPRHGAPPKPCPVCGAKVRWWESTSGQADSKYICAVDWTHKFKNCDVEIFRWKTGGDSDATKKGLLLGWEGKPVFTSCDFATRKVNDLVAEGLAPKSSLLRAPLEWLSRIEDAKDLGQSLLQVFGGTLVTLGDEAGLETVWEARGVFREIVEVVTLTPTETI